MEITVKKIFRTGIDDTGALWVNDKRTFIGTRQEQYGTFVYDNRNGEEIILDQKRFALSTDAGQQELIDSLVRSGVVIVMDNSEENEMGSEEENNSTDDLSL